MAWVLIQVGLPLFLLGTGVRPLPFGWHMYSGAYPFPLVVVEVAGGAPVRVDMQPYIPHTRLDLDYTRYIPPFICAEVPGAIAVRLQLPGNPSPERHRCP